MNNLSLQLIPHRSSGCLYVGIRSACFLLHIRLTRYCILRASRSGKVIYDCMRQGSLPTTSQANPEEAAAVLEKIINEQNVDILHIAFSSGLSGSYSNARLAAGELSEKYPDRKIIVIDSLCASLGEGLLVHKAVTLKEQGHTLEETADWLESNKLHLVHNFTVNDLFHLYRGGRVSKTAAFLGTMISLKPLLHVDDEGHLIPLSKVRGRKKSLIALVDAMEKQIGSWRDKNDIIFISHGDCIEDAQYVADLIKDRFGYESFLINHVGPTIGAHEVHVFFIWAITVNRKRLFCGVAISIDLSD